MSTGRRLALAASAVLAAVTGGAVWQWVAERRAAVRYRRQGHLRRVGDALVHVVVEGEGDPAVVIVSGLGGSHLEWEQVAAGLRTTTRVVRYDRPGFAFSPYTREDRRPAQATDALRAVLAAERVPPPYLLVGHSLGGLHVRAYAALFPQEVAGAVLVEPSHEDSMVPASNRRLARAAAWGMRVAAFLAPLGAGRVLGRVITAASRNAAVAPEAAWVAANQKATGTLTHRTVDGLRGAAADWAGAVDAHTQVGDLSRTHGFPPVPLTVISGGRDAATPLERPGLEFLRNELHPRTAALSPYGRHVVAERAGHLVPLDQPEIVVEEVRAMLARLRATT